jgi:hypothetical protein
MPALEYTVQEDGKSVIQPEDLQLDVLKELRSVEDPLNNPFYLDLDAAVFLYTD